MDALQDLLQQREALENKIRQARQAKIADAVATCRKLVAEHGLTAQDLFGGRGRGRKSSAAGSKVPPKYRNNATGQTWTGRGKPPQWIQDKNRDEYLIK